MADQIFIELERRKTDTIAPDAPTRSGPARSGAKASAGNLFSPGDVLNSTYAILSRIASGGMGCVYLAHDQTLNRRVAVKASLAGVARDTLANEARVLAAFRHPGLPTVYAFGNHAGIDYLVMERLPGITLSESLEQRGSDLVPIAEALDVLISIGETLAVLHGAGLAHRDLKPDNIMLCGQGRVVLMDCGIAIHERFIGGDRVVCGSPTHMAPESVQATVKTGEAHLTDLYSLAVVAFELLTGEPLFRGEGLEELMRRHLRETPRRARDLRTDVPLELDDLLAAMLSKRPEGRPPSIENVNTILRAIRRDLPAQAAPRPSVRQPTRPRPRPPIVRRLPVASTAETVRH